MAEYQPPGICGLGAVTGYGSGAAALWEGLLTGKPAARLVDGYGHGRDESAWVARVPAGPEGSTSRFSHSLRSATQQAIDDAKARGWEPGDRVGLIHAAVLGDVDLWEEFHATEGDSPWRPRKYLGLMPSTPVSMTLQEHGLHGPAMHVCAMCASGMVAALTAKSWLDSGMADDVVIVAADVSASPATLSHWSDIGAAITDVDPLQGCRPFQEGSRGFGWGEAAAALVLSARSGQPYSRLLGGAMSQDAHHVISVEPSHEHVKRCFREALADAGVSPAEVDYLYAHGTGTKQCDSAEIDVLETLFPPSTGVYSTKPLTGHTQGASAALELGIHALSLEHGVIPAPPAMADGHPQLLTDPSPVTDGLTVKSALGMGGYNAVGVLAPA